MEAPGVIILPRASSKFSIFDCFSHLPGALPHLCTKACACKASRPDTFGIFGCAQAALQTNMCLNLHDTDISYTHIVFQHDTVLVIGLCLKLRTWYRYIPEWEEEMSAIGRLWVEETEPDTDPDSAMLASDFTDINVGTSADDVPNAELENNDDSVDETEDMKLKGPQFGSTDL